MHLCSPLLWRRRLARIVCCTFKSFAASPPDRMRILTPRVRSCTAPDRLRAAMLGDQRADGRRGRRSRKTSHSTRAELENVIYVECMAFTGLQLALRDLRTQRAVFVTGRDVSRDTRAQNHFSKALLRTNRLSSSR
jgi:hypothetical protein